MPTFYNFKQDGNTHSFDDVFISADAFRQGNLWVWGRNSYGSLGINDSGSRSAPVTTFAGGTNWKSSFSTGGQTEAIKTDGTLWVWGYGGYGALGDNGGGNRNTPVTTFAGGTNWKQVSTGAAIKTDGTLWVWGGNNGEAQLGNNDTTARSVPVTTFAGGTNWKSVSCGFYHNAAIKTDGTLWVWGANNATSIGINGGGGSISTPVTTFAGGTNWKQVTCGYLTTAAIKTDGTLWTWGYDYLPGPPGNAGILGNNIFGGSRATPVTTFAGGTNWKQVTNNDLFSYSATKTDGTLWIWGRNAYGQLGINDTTDRATPVTTFAGGTNWKSVGGCAAIEYIDPVL